MNAANIDDGDSFKAWLDTWPTRLHLKVSSALAYRIAMQALPITNYVDVVGHSDFWRNMFWRCIIARTFAYGTNSQLLAATNFSRSFAFSTYVASWAVNATLGQGIYPNWDAVNAAAEAVASAGPESSIYIWESIRKDANEFDAGRAFGYALYEKPLWRDAPQWWRDGLAKLNKRLTEPSMVDDGFRVWLNWYETIAEGQPAFGLKNRKSAEALERAIALGGKDNKFHREFWDRQPGEINREIAEWVAESRAAETSVRLPVDDVLDLSSRPASVQTTVAKNMVVLEIVQPDVDIARDLLASAIRDLKAGLGRLEAAARLKNAPEALLIFFNETAASIETAQLDQSKLFESGRNLKALQGYGSTVTEEWDSFSAAQYHALVLQFDEVIKKFPVWQAFVSAPPKAAAGTTASDVANVVGEIAEAITQQPDIVAATIAVRLKALAVALNDAARRAEDHVVSGRGGHVATELLMSDAAQSVANTLMSVVKLGLENVSPMALRVGGKIADGAGQGLVNTVSLIIPILALLAIPKLAKMFPGVFDHMKAGAKILQGIWKED